MVFIIGSLAICLVGSICSSLTLGARTGNIISPLLILPLTIPVLIFGISTCEALKSNLDPYPNLYLLISFSLILIILSPILTAASVKDSIKQIGLIMINYLGNPRRYEIFKFWEPANIWDIFIIINYLWFIFFH